MLSKNVEHESQNNLWLQLMCYTFTSCTDVKDNSHLLEIFINNMKDRMDEATGWKVVVKEN